MIQSVVFFLDPEKIKTIIKNLDTNIKKFSTQQKIISNRAKWNSVSRLQLIFVHLNPLIAKK